MEDAGKPPMFFKFFTAQHSSQRMKFPPAFLAYMKGQTPRAILLTGPGGDSWTVSLIEEEDTLYFAGGWPEFVEDHSIQTGDFLVFQYDGEAGMVQVFDPTMSPREASFHAWNSHKVTTELIRYDEVLPIKQDSSKRGAKGSSRAADEFCFQITMKAFHVQKAIFPIPRWFSERHIRWQRGIVNVLLCDQGGKQWPVSMICRKDITKRESWYLSKGLAAFIREDRVQEGDTCTFEFLSPSLLQVRNSRA